MTGGRTDPQQQMRGLQNTQLTQLEHLIAQQRKAHQRMRHVLREAEKVRVISLNEQPINSLYWCKHTECNIIMTSPPKGSHIVFMVILKFFELIGNFCYVGILL